MHMRDVFAQSGFSARFEWGEQGVRRFAPLSDVVVVIDVLSFTTCVEVATSRGALVYPYRFKDESAIRFAADVDALLAGKRGAGLSLSPPSLRQLAPDSRVVLPSPNGSTCTVVAAEAGSLVVAGCLRNAGAVARFVQRQGGVVSVIACGERWEDGSLRPSFEDLVGAGAVLSHFAEASLSPEARAAVAAYESVRGDLPGLLQNCSSGRELIAGGYAEDVAMAGDLGASDVVPMLAAGQLFYRGHRESEHGQADFCKQ